MPPFQSIDHTDRLHHATGEAIAKADVLVAQMSSGDKACPDFTRVARLLQMLSLRPHVARAGELPRARLSYLDRDAHSLAVAPSLSIPEIRHQLVLEVGYHLLYPDHDRALRQDRDAWFREDIAAAWTRAFLVPRRSLPRRLSDIQTPTCLLNLCALLGVVPEILELRIADLHVHGQA